MAVSRWARFAAGVPVPVFAAAGIGGWGPVQELRGVTGVRLVPTPRHAAVLLVAGAVPAAQLEALRRVHDQVPHPRITVAWRASGAAEEVRASVSADGGSSDVTAALTDAFTRVVADPAASEDDLLPDVEPKEWRGVGPFGQGGEGMMGGTPYGRPMAMTGDDRDGLALDRLHVPLGPFLDALPAGLLLDVVLQGEVVQQVTPQVDPLSGDAGGFDPLLPSDASRAAARRGLRWLAHALHVAGLDGLAARAAGLASRVTDDADRATLSGDVIRLLRRIRWTGVLHTLRGVGASTASVDGDVAERWRRRMGAIAATLADGAVPRDGVAADALEPMAFDAASNALVRMLPGLTLTDAVSTIVSLDIDCWRATAVAG